MLSAGCLTHQESVTYLLWNLCGLGIITCLQSVQLIRSQQLTVPVKTREGLKIEVILPLDISLKAFTMIRKHGDLTQGCEKVSDNQGLGIIFFFFVGHKSFLVGPLIPLFLTSGDVCPGFQSQGGFPRLHASSPVHNRFLRFTSGVTPAFSTNSGVHYISVYTAWLANWLFSHASEFEPPMQWWAAQRCVTKSDALPTELSRRPRSWNYLFHHVMSFRSQFPQL